MFEKSQIYLRMADDYDVIDKVVEAMSRYEDIPFYQRSGQIVHILDVKDKRLFRHQPGLAEGVLTIQHLTAVTSRVYADLVGTYKRYDARAEDWKQCPFPQVMARELVDLGHYNHLPVLSGITEVPTLRPNGTVLSTPGYDRVTGLYFDPRGVKFPPVPAHPTREDALHALSILRRPFKDFAFAQPHHESVALAGLLTACNKRAVPIAPLFAITAPKQGSGKSLLVDAISIISSGNVASVLAQSDDESENEKRIGATLMRGARIVSFDNMEHALCGSFLNQCLTQEVVQHRPLGISKTLDIPNTATFFATGNNLRVDGDMVRRTLLCEIDPDCEKPYERDFGYDLKEYCVTHRADISVAGLILLRAFLASGDKVDLTPYASFPEWDKLIRRALVWVEMVDPVESLKEVIDTDSVTGTLSSLLEALYEIFSHHEFTTHEVIEYGSRIDRTLQGGDGHAYPKLHNALMDMAFKGDISSRQVGYYFRKYQKRKENGLELRKMKLSNGYQKWVIKSTRRPDTSGYSEDPF